MIRRKKSTRKISIVNVLQSPYLNPCCQIIIWCLASLNGWRKIIHCEGYTYVVSNLTRERGKGRNPPSPSFFRGPGFFQGVEFSNAYIFSIVFYVTNFCSVLYFSLGPDFLSKVVCCLILCFLRCIFPTLSLNSEFYFQTYPSFVFRLYSLRSTTFWLYATLVQLQPGVIPKAEETSAPSKKKLSWFCIFFCTRLYTVFFMYIPTPIKLCLKVISGAEQIQPLPRI